MKKYPPEPLFGTFYCLNQQLGTTSTVLALSLAMSLQIENAHTFRRYAREGMRDPDHVAVVCTASDAPWRDNVSIL